MPWGWDYLLLIPCVTQGRCVRERQAWFGPPCMQRNSWKGHGRRWSNLIPSAWSSGNMWMTARQGRGHQCPLGTDPCTVHTQLPTSAWSNDPACDPFSPISLPASMLCVWCWHRQSIICIFPVLWCTVKDQRKLCKNTLHPMPSHTYSQCL